MKVITRLVNIENEAFVLVYLENYKKYGTIPYSELNEKGCLKRQLNGLEMNVEDTIEKCLETTKRHILLSRFINENNLDLFNNADDVKKYMSYARTI